MRTSGKIAGLLFLAGALAPRAAFALGFDWNALASLCSDTRLDGFEKFIPQASEWEGFQQKTQGEIETLTSKTCPTYLQSANGARGMADTLGMTLEQYIADHNHTFSDAGDSTGRGRKHEKYLADTFSHASAVHAKYGFDFSNDACGAGIQAAKKHVASVLATIESKSAAAGTTCSSLAQKIASEGPTAKSLDAVLGKGDADPQAGHPPSSESTITGQPQGEPYGGGYTGLQYDKPKIPIGEMPPDAAGGASAPFVGAYVQISETADGARSGASKITGGGSADRVSAPAAQAPRVADESAGRLLGLSAEAPSAFAPAATVSRGAAAEETAKGTGFDVRRPASVAGVSVETVPLHNEDQSRFQTEFASSQAAGERQGERSLFDLVSHRYRVLSAGLK
jgi:hypothetical protein